MLIRHGWNWKEIFRVSWNWTHGYCRDRNILKFKCKSVEYYLIIIYKTYILLESYCIKNVHVSMYVQSTLSKTDIFRTGTSVCPGES